MMLYPGDPVYKGTRNLFPTRKQFLKPQPQTTTYNEEIRFKSETTIALYASYSRTD